MEKKLRHVADLFNRDSLIEKFNSIKTSLNGVKGKVVKKVGTVAAIGVTAMMLAGCPQPTGQQINITPSNPSSIHTQGKTGQESVPYITPEQTPDITPEPYIEPDTTEPEPVIEPDPIDPEPTPVVTPEQTEPEPVIEPDPIDPEPTPVVTPEQTEPLFLQWVTPQSHTQIGDSPYELHCFGDTQNLGRGLSRETINEIDAYTLVRTQNYFKGKAQQIENNTADRPAIRVYFQDLIDRLNNADQYNTFGDLCTAINEMGGRYMADVARNVNNSTQYEAIELSFGILANENDKSGYGASFVGWGDYDYRINRQNFASELAETNPYRNYIFEYCNVNIADEYTNGFQGTRTVLDGVTDNILQKMNANDSRFNNQLTLADEQMVYDIVLATHAVKSSARMFNSGRDRVHVTEECQMQGAYNGWTYTPHIRQQNGNERGL